MSTNISKKKRDDLLDKIKQIRAFIAAAPQDENTGNLLSYLSELEKDVNGKKYGLIFEKHREEIDEVLDTHTPVLAEEADLFIDHGGQMNFLLEGDNLAALKLLEKTHRGKIYLIYIDPPYNTGNKDFIYDDAFVDKNDCFTHSKWLSFMEKRLKIARRLLSGNGVIFISIDDREEAGLRLLCDEIFGENCFVSNISWQRNYSARNDSKGIVTEVEHLLVYSRSEEWSPKKLPRTAEMDAKYKNPDNDFAMWRTDNAYAPGASTHQGMVYHRNPKKALLSVAKYFEETFKTGTNGTEDSTEIWMLRYGFSFEEIEWLKPCVESIDQTEIRFNGEIESLDDFQRSSIAQYLF